MSSRSYSTRSLPFLADFTTAERQTAERALALTATRREKAAAAAGRRLDQYVESFQRQLHQLVGAKKFATLQGEIRRERAAFRDLWQPPEGLKRDYSKTRKQSAGRVAALFRAAGVNHARLAKLRRKASEAFVEHVAGDDIAGSVGYHLPKHLDRWTKLSPLHERRLPWENALPPADPNDPHRWFLERPPFFGFLFHEDLLHSDGFVIDHQMLLAPSAGLVGHRTSMVCDDASSFDLSQATVESQVAFAFRPPVAGVIEVLIDAQCTEDRHRAEFEDEFGFSSAWSKQRSQLMLNVLHPNVTRPSVAVLSEFAEETDGDDRNVERSNLTGGQHYFAQLFSAAPVPAGQKVILTVGARTFDQAFANDMRTTSLSDVRWFLSSIEVRIAP